MNKTDFLSATTCTTMAWHQTRQERLQPDEAAMFRMEQGREIGEFARRLFPGGILVHGPNEFCVAETQRLLASEATTTIFEATFRSGAFTAKADLLIRNDDGWDVLEVKSSFSNSAKAGKEYVDDLAYTVMVLRRAGIMVKRSVLVLLSREYRYDNPVDRLFAFVDKTDDVDVRARTFEDGADAICAAVLAERTPQPELKRACRSCYFFKTACLGSMHEHTVLELPKLHHATFKKLCAAGIVDITDVPTDFKLNGLQQRAKAVAESGETFVAPELGNELAAIEWPCHYLDFETVASIMPLYDGHGCHHQVLTQFSVHHRESLDAAPSHSEFLADAEESQERLLAECLIKVLGAQGAIVVYSNFENVRVKALVEEFPDLADPLNAIRARFVDFERIIRKHVYHPAFAGSFSLKKVVPALVTDVSYDGLAIADGDNAIATFARMARGEIENVAEARKNLLAYCETDTFVMVKLHEILAGMVA